MHALADSMPMNLEIVRETIVSFAKSHVAVENMKSCLFHHFNPCCWGGLGMLDQLMARKAQTGLCDRTRGGESDPLLDGRKKNPEFETL